MCLAARGTGTLLAAAHACRSRSAAAEDALARAADALAALCKGSGHAHASSAPGIGPAALLALLPGLAAWLGRRAPCGGDDAQQLPAGALLSLAQLTRYSV